MIRTHTFIADRAFWLLKDLSEITGLSSGEHIRRALDEYLERQAALIKDDGSAFKPAVPATIGERLAQARVLKGLSQTELGKIAGMAPTQVSRYEAGRAMPRGFTLGKLAESLGVRREWLQDGDGGKGGRP